MKNELNLFNFDVFYERRNASPKPNYKKNPLFDDRAILKKATEKNQLDIELYQYAKRNIFPKYRDNFSGDLEKELKAFNEANNNFKSCSVRRGLWIVYRWIFYRNLEYILLKAFHRPLAA